MRQPLLTLSEARVQGELRRAAALAADAAAQDRRTRRLVGICITDYLTGMMMVAVSLHIADADWGPVLFFLGLLGAVGGPIWTVLLSRWLEDNGLGGRLTSA
jgi:hypothetical protein